MYKFGFCVALAIFSAGVEGQRQQNPVKVSPAEEMNHHVAQPSRVNTHPPLHAHGFRSLWILPTSF